MARRRVRTWVMGWLGLLIAIIVVIAIVLFLFVRANVASSTTSTSAAPMSTTTTSEPIPKERRQADWTVASSSARGVMVDYRNITVGGVTFRALRLRARTTLLRWHVGSSDPNLASKVPYDAGPAIAWQYEGAPGVVAVFNGGFKQAAASGGAVADGLVLEPLLASHMTIALDAAGHWAMGVWGSPNFPPKGFHPIAYRQNLGPLVWNARVTPEALSGPVGNWGSPLGGVPGEPRTGLGVDARGNLIYVATMAHVLPAQLGQAMVAVGVVTGMQLDINPFWPIMGASFHPIHANGGPFPVQLPMAEHSPTIYETGWTRDFFVALAEPPNWSCSWSSVGLGASGQARAQPLRLHGQRCGAANHPSPKATTTTSPSNSAAGS